MRPPDIKLIPVPFDDLPGWGLDDHRAAFAAFGRSARRLCDRAAAGTAPRTSDPLLAILRTALEIRNPSAEVARAFFERLFTPHEVVADEQATGLLTGYYEPVLEGSRVQTDEFTVPLLRRPADLVNLVDESERAAMAHGLTHARKTATGIEPYATRTEIEEGALASQALEIVWLRDPVEAFFLHIQGSGEIRCVDGTRMRLTYDGKNGHPYTSVGRVLIDAGLFPADEMSLDALKDWLRADPERGKTAMRSNASYIFFRELRPDEGDEPLGTMEIPLTPGRSLAVDTAYHEIGTPIYVVASELRLATGAGGLERLMIAQDVGSAIRGPERGDYFYGSGDEAGRLAGITKHAVRFTVLRPNAVS